MKERSKGLKSLQTNNSQTRDKLSKLSLQVVDLQMLLGSNLPTKVVQV